MKKSLNTFRTVRLQNALRWLGICCAVFVVAAAALLALTPQNRERLFGGFERGEGLQPKTDGDEPESEAGLQGEATVNEALAVRPLSAGDHLMGDIAAPVQMIVYEDFECPFCAQLYDSLEQARKEFGAKLVVAVRNYPMASHELALKAANAAECAGEQAKYPEAYHALFAANKAEGLSVDGLAALGKALKLDEGVYADCLTKEKYNDKILAEKEEVKKLGVIGTPASFLNGEYIAGALPYEDFTYPDGSKGEGLKALIAKKLAEQK